jgi:hypothetical protein
VTGVWVKVHEKYAPLERGAGRRSAPCPTQENRYRWADPARV